MAGIYVDSKTSSSVILYLSGLDTNWSSGTRTVYWYLGSPGGSIPTESVYHKKQTISLADGVSSGAIVSFTGLESNTQYGILCAIYHGSTLLKELTGYVKTDVEGGSISWTMVTVSNQTITEKKEIAISLGSYQIIRIGVIPYTSGVVKFYTTGSVDTHGFLSKSKDWIENSGVPNQILVSNDDDGDGFNFSFSYNFTDADVGTTYYVWVRTPSGVDVGESVLHIEPFEWTLIDNDLGYVDTNKRIDISLGEYEIYRYSVRFRKNTPVKIYTTGQTDVYGYFCSREDWNHTQGRPYYVIYSKTDSNTDNFSCEFEVVSDGDVEPSYEYYIYVRSSTGLNTGNTTLHIDVSSTSDIDKWDWFSSNGTATATQTSTAYNAVVNKTAVTNFSYIVWNDMVDKVKEVLDYIGDTWHSNYATYANTKMTSADKTLTASRFNSLRFNIGKHYSTGINDVQPNDKVYGHYFTTLIDCLNNWIDTL